MASLSVSPHMNSKKILISPLIFISLIIGTMVIAQNEKVKPRFSTIIDAEKGNEMYPYGEVALI